jgi:hypothetical protein
MGNYRTAVCIKNKKETDRKIFDKCIKNAFYFGKNLLDSWFDAPIGKRYNLLIISKAGRNGGLALEGSSNNAPETGRMPDENTIGNIQFCGRPFNTSG